MPAERGDEILRVEALRENLVEGQQRSCVISRKRGIHNLEAVFVVEDIEVFQHVLVFDFSSAERHRLVEDGEGVAHGSVRLAGDDMQRFVVHSDPLFGRNHAQVLHDVRHADSVEIVGLAARKDSREYLVLLGRTQDEDRVCRRLLERLEKGVEGRLREHMDLIDDVHAVLSDLRGNLHLVHQGLDIVHAVVRSGVQFAYAVRTALGERLAGLALAARLHVRRRVRAVDSLREDARCRGLANSAGTAEKIGVGQLPPDDGVLQGSGDIVLSDESSEGIRTVLSC